MVNINEVFLNIRTNGQKKRGFLVVRLYRRSPPSYLYELSLPLALDDGSPDYVKESSSSTRSRCTHWGHRLMTAWNLTRWYWERQRIPEMKEYPYKAHYGKVVKYGRSDEYLGISSAGIGWDGTTGSIRF
jgi:hypothetical protein